MRILHEGKRQLPDVLSTKSEPRSAVALTTTLYTSRNIFPVHRARYNTIYKTAHGSITSIRLTRRLTSNLGQA